MPPRTNHDGEPADHAGHRDEGGRDDACGFLADAGVDAAEGDQEEKGNPHALYTAAESAMKNGDAEAMAASIDFPIFMATDNAAGQGMAYNWDLREVARDDEAGDAEHAQGHEVVAQAQGRPSSPTACTRLSKSTRWRWASRSRSGRATAWW